MTMTMMLQTTRRDVLPLQHNITATISIPMNNMIYVSQGKKK